MKNDDFYVGYLDPPPELARFLRRLAIGLPLLALGLAVVLAVSQARQPSGIFEFGVSRTLEGILFETPLPMLRVDAGQGHPAVFLLSGFGKAGLPEFARGHHGSRVRFTGWLIHRRNAAMIQINDEASFEVLQTPADSAGRRPPEVVGELTVTGELVDTKCFLGVMRPATGKVHRACAVRCLKGGVPPGLLVRGPAGTSTLLLLAGPPGEPLDLDLELAGRELTIQGTLEFHDDLSVLRVGEARLSRG